MPVNLNFSNVKDFKRPDEGTYTFLIQDAEIEPTKAGDSENLKVTFEVLDEGDNEGRTVQEYFSLKEGALWMLKAFLEAVFNEEIPKDEFELDEEVLPGNSVVAVVRHNGDYANLEGYANPENVKVTTSLSDPVYGDDEPF